MNNIPKGFKEYWIDGDIPYSQSLIIAMEKSIYDKRMKLITMRVLTKEHTFWEVKDTNYICKVLGGEFDNAI